MQWEARAELQCPYCGEPTTIAVDLSAGDADIIEDCQVCCRPIMVEVVIEDLEHGVFSLTAQAAS